MYNEDRICDREHVPCIITDARSDANKGACCEEGVTLPSMHQYGTCIEPSGSPLAALCVTLSALIQRGATH